MRYRDEKEEEAGRGYRNTASRERGSIKEGLLYGIEDIYVRVIDLGGA